ncbi:MAG: murein hydrolase activator EnvC family protein, partial [Beijerinckiaceae bacterium]
EAARVDRGRLNAGLVESAERLRASESRMAALEQRLATMESSENAVRASLQARRALITEVLAALQRMGRKPPPAIFVRPEDILSAVRAAIALGAVMPELRAETQALAADLASLVRIREGMAEERNRLTGEMRVLSEERLKLAGLMEARQQQLKDSEKSASAEAQRAIALGQQAKNLRELLQKFESDIAAATRAAEEAARAQAGLSREAQDRMAALAAKDPARLQPKIAFAQATGTLNLPVGGAILRKFGEPDDSGSPARGMTIAGRSGAIVTAPADAWVAYAGPFRSFGHLLILNAGGGYYILLAGMERMTVELGQFVIAGEPVAMMGKTAAQAVSQPAAGGADTNQPVLYVEFRKDGASIDPAPWWARSDMGKVRG